MRIRRLKNGILSEYWGEAPEQPLDPPDPPEEYDRIQDEIEYAKNHPLEGAMGDYYLEVNENNIKVVVTKKRDNKLDIKVLADPDDLEENANYESDAYNVIDDCGDPIDSDIDYFLDNLNEWDSELDFSKFEELLVTELANDNDYNIKEGAYYIDFCVYYDATADYEVVEDYSYDYYNGLAYSCGDGKVANPEIIIGEIRTASNRPVYMSEWTKKRKEHNIGYTIYRRGKKDIKPTVYQRVLAKRNIPIKRKRK